MPSLPPNYRGGNPLPDSTDPVQIGAIKVNDIIHLFVLNSTNQTVSVSCEIMVNSNKQNILKDEIVPNDTRSRTCTAKEGAYLILEVNKILQIYAPITAHRYYHISIQKNLCHLSTSPLHP